MALIGVVGTPRDNRHLRPFQFLTKKTEKDDIYKILVNFIAGINKNRNC